MMRRRSTLITLIVAELAGVLLLVVLYLVFRVMPATPGPVATPVAHVTPTPRAGRTPTGGLPAPTSAPTGTTVVAAAASPTPQATQRYTVTEGDTLWGIAVTFHLTLDEVVAANPGI